MSAGAVAAGYDWAADQFPAELSAESDSRLALERWAPAAPAGGTVLDVGCGAGRASRWLAAHGFRVLSLDLSPEMLRRTRAGRPAAWTAVSDMRALPVARGAAGGLTAFFSVTHIPKAAAPPVFAEFRRVVAPGGALLVAMVGGEGDEEEAAAWAGGAVMHFSGYREAELRALFEGHGFAVFGTHSSESEFHGKLEQHLFMFGRAV